MNTPALPGSLYLFPVTLGECDPAMVLPAHNLQIMPEIRCFIAEDARTARRTLSSIGVKGIRDIEILEFNLQSDPLEIIPQFLSIVSKGISVGLLSEAGCPAVADPGAAIVMAAHKNRIPVIPLVGPSSLLLGLMASGLNGQRFSFHGYLPVSQPERIKAIRQLEQESAKRNQTQLFIETPYRNDKMLADLLATLNGETWLSVAADLTLPAQTIMTKRVREWKKEKNGIGKRPAVFLMLSGE